MADKKITELPFITDVTASVGNTATTRTVIPVVLYGTTNQITADNLKDNFIREVRSTVAGIQTYTSSLKGAATVSGNGLQIAGNLEVGGMITAQQYNVTYVSSSVQYQSGSTEFGDTADDTHTFTGTVSINGVTIGASAVNSFTASQLAVNLRIASTTGSINTTTSSFDTIFQRIGSTTSSINTTTSSFDSVFLGISSVTGAMNTTTSSFNSVFQRISSTTSSINTTTSSFDSVFLGISSVTGAMNTQSSSQDLVNRQISLVSGSIHFTTGALNSFTGSIIGQTNTISTFTSSVNLATQSLNTQTGSQNSLNTSLGLITSSIYGEITSFNSVFQRISSTTGSINTQTGSQDLVNLGISSVTGSLIGITNGLMAFTAALDNTYATDAQLYQLYQATASIQFATASLNTQTGSQDLVNLSISTYTGSQNVINTSVDSHILKQATQTGSQDLVNLGISTATGSLIGITNGLMALTASMKGQAIVSSSTQITNYYKFAQTASANTFYGNQTISGSLFVSGASEFGGNLVPKEARGATLGTLERPFSEIFVSSGSINIASDIIGDPNTTLTNIGGNILVSAGGMRLLGSSSFIAATGSFSFISGSMRQVGNYSQTGDYTLVGNKTITGSLYVSSSLKITNGFYVDGHKQFNYGEFSDNTIQSASANIAYPMKLNTTDLAEGFSVVSGSRITAVNGGTYNLQFSAQLLQTTNNSPDISIWFRKNGNNIPNSNTNLTIEKISGGGQLVAAWNYIVRLNATEYVEIMWSSTRSDTQLAFIGEQSTPTRPATPSVIVTMTQIA